MRDAYLRVLLLPAGYRGNDDNKSGYTNQLVGLVVSPCEMHVSSIIISRPQLYDESPTTKAPRHDHFAFSPYLTLPFTTNHHFLFILLCHALGSFS